MTIEKLLQEAEILSERMAADFGAARGTGGTCDTPAEQFDRAMNDLEELTAMTEALYECRKDLE